MISKLANTYFYKELETSLGSSTANERIIWAKHIIENNIAIKDLSSLISAEPKIATRYLWLLSEIGILNPIYLLQELPFLFEQCKKIQPSLTSSFANFWHLAGVPVENESEAITLLFHWLLSPKINSTIKSRSIWVLFALTKKYPELGNELKLCIQDQQYKHSKDFEKRVQKVLQKLE